MAVWTGLIVMMAVWVTLMAVTATRVPTRREPGPDDRPGGAGRTTDWSTGPVERSMAPHAR